jgi:hypothetical protein
MALERAITQAESNQNLRLAEAIPYGLLSCQRLQMVLFFFVTVAIRHPPMRVFPWRKRNGCRPQETPI